MKMQLAGMGENRGRAMRAQGRTRLAIEAKAVAAGWVMPIISSHANSGQRYAWQLAIARQAQAYLDLNQWQIAHPSWRLGAQTMVTADDYAWLLAGNTLYVNFPNPRHSTHEAVTYSKRESYASNFYKTRGPFTGYADLNAKIAAQIAADNAANSGGFFSSITGMLPSIVTKPLSVSGSVFNTVTSIATGGAMGGKAGAAKIYGHGLVGRAMNNAGMVLNPLKAGVSNTYMSNRDDVEAGLVLVGNYYIPGSSILTAKLASKKAGAELGDKYGIVAQLASSAVGMGVGSSVTGIQASTVGQMEANAISSGYSSATKSLSSGMSSLSTELHSAIPTVSSLEHKAVERVGSLLTGGGKSPSLSTVSDLSATPPTTPPATTFNPKTLLLLLPLALALFE
jgi:hypothetical protein